MYLVTAQEMAEIDRFTIQKIGIPGIVLMENAARGACQFFQEVLPDLLKKSIAVVSGPGNNGGDGLAIARILYGKGASVKVFCLKSPQHFSQDALLNYEIVTNLGLPVYFLSEEEGKEWDLLSKSAIVIDALLGTGLTREVTGVFKKAIDHINSMGVPVLSVDIPSGVDGSTGKIMGTAISAYATATFGLPKIGHVCWPGMRYVGKLGVIDIGIPPSVIEQHRITRYLLTAEFMAKTMESRPLTTHKGQAGHVAILAGSPGKTGAAAMAALAALRGGAGLVTLMTPRSLNPIFEVKLTEPMTLPLPETEGQSVSLEALDEIMDFISNKQCLAVGPGASLHPETQELMRQLIVTSPCPVVADADALTSLVGRCNILRDATSPVVITPHPGEMARLLEISTVDVQANRIKVAELFAKDFEVIVVLKGHRTVVADPSGRVAINTTGNPAMASGGMGDILTGLITSLIGQGLDAFEAACVGVFVHGLAADRIVERKNWGSRGLAATDLLDEIPRILRELEKQGS
ncbi:MAG: NAD(P)H-hydrate dehydratase [Syntrophobacterales bacterium]|nr:NAD(P)H-hydrate dehydratase [Syntrophobacterales bacterium]